MIDQGLEACVNLVQNKTKEDLLTQVLAGKCHILSGKTPEDKVQVIFPQAQCSDSGHKLLYFTHVQYTAHSCTHARPCCTIAS